MHNSPPRFLHMELVVYSLVVPLSCRWCDRLKKLSWRLSNIFSKGKWLRRRKTISTPNTIESLNTTKKYLKLFSFFLGVWRKKVGSPSISSQGVGKNLQIVAINFKKYRRAFEWPFKALQNFISCHLRRISFNSSHHWTPIDFINSPSLDVHRPPAARRILGTKRSRTRKWPSKLRKVAAWSVQDNKIRHLSCVFCHCLLWPKKQR